MTANSGTSFASQSMIRLRPPRMGRSPIILDRVVNKIQDASALALTLVLSGAGYGKTTILTQYHEKRIATGKDVAWLSISLAERDETQFLKSILQSLNEVDKNIGSAGLSFLQGSGAAAVPAILDSLIEELAGHHRSVALIIDDYHLIENDDNNRILESILKVAPRNFSLVLSSRTVPQFDMVNLKVQGQVTEFDTSDLRWDRQEAQNFLSQNLSFDLKIDNEKEILDYIDGWAMGLQVAAITIGQSGGADQFVDRMSKNGSDISNFFANDILDVLKPELISFLKETTHLEILTPELCNACTSRNDGKEMLDELERLNLFIQRVDKRELWFQYHHLFRDFLRRHFEITETKNTKSRHKRAFNWFAENGLHEHAIPHALFAELWDDAQNSLEKIWKTWLASSRFEQLQSWLNKIPASVLKGNPTLQIAMIWADALQRRHQKASKGFNELIHHLKISKDDLTEIDFTDDPVKTDLLILKCAIDNMFDDNEEIVKLAKMPYEMIDSLDGFSQGLLFNYLIYARVLAGKFDQADRMAERALHYQLETGDILVAVYNPLFQGLGKKMSGDLDGAIRAYSRAADLSWKHFGFVYSAADFLFASVAYELGDLSAAERHLGQAQNAPIAPATLDPVIAKYLTASKLLCVEGKTSEALELLSRAELQGHSEGRIRLLAAALVERISILIKEKKLAVAEELLEELYATTEPKRGLTHFSWPMSKSLVAQAEAMILIARGDFERARVVIRPFIIEAESSGRVHPLLKFLVLDVHTYLAGERPKLAARRLAKAISVASKGKYIRIFIDNFTTENQLFLSALTRCALDGVDPAYLKKLSNEMNLPLASWTVEETKSNSDSDMEITARESDLLVALGAGLTNRQIAKDMHISVNTVAWHLKNLYAKLGVSSRTAAVGKARKVGLLS